MKLIDKAAPCRVCGKSGRWQHGGHVYCAANDCQLVAAGIITIGEARARSALKPTNEGEKP